MEYLSPGVYVEETSYRAKSIEGVSTSTAGFVGAAKAGPAGTPQLVTSVAQFQRQFGTPFAMPLAENGQYLAHAVRAFFENGGSRAWIVRVLGELALTSETTGYSGVLLHVASSQTVTELASSLRVDSLRGISNGIDVRIFHRPGPAGAWSSFVRTVASYNSLSGSMGLAATGGAPETFNLDPNHSYVILDGAAPSQPAAGEPVFSARHPGDAGDELSVLIHSSDRPPVRIVSNVVAASDVFEVARLSGLYEGAIVEVDGGGIRGYSTVVAIDAGASTVTLADDANTIVGGGIVVATPSIDYIRVIESSVSVSQNGSVIEEFAGLSWNPDTTLGSFSRYLIEVINDGSNLISVAWVGGTAPARTVDGAPTNNEGLPLSLQGGFDGNPPTNIHLVGQDLGPGSRTGIQALSERDDIAIVAVPGVTDELVQGALITHCELQRYRFAVLDGESGVSDVAQIQTHRNNYDSKYAAYYTPWFTTIDLATGREITIPPSGSVIGIYARSDNERGVHKAPANEVVRGILDVELPFTKGEQDVLNPTGVNLTREFTGRGIRVWGARTISSDSEWKYVNIRRFFIYLEHSIDKATQWVVFEPNGEALWARVRQTIESFLLNEWKSGRLMGSKPEEAYFVRCDRSTMTQNDLDNGRLICQIGVSPIFPAEFVIFRIGQWTGSASN